MTAIFGARYDAPAFEDSTVLRTPVGACCLMCGEKVAMGDSGVFMPVITTDDIVTMEPEHIECHLRAAVGSIEHLQGTCTCFDGPGQHDDLSYRESARRTMEWLQNKPRLISLID